MRLGAMNHPMRDTVGEIASFGEAGFGFVDLTLEPARARSSDIDVAAVRSALKEAGIVALGHTAYFLPIASPYDELREVALLEVERCIDVFASLDVPTVSIHPDPRVPLHGPEYVVDRNIEAIVRLADFASKRGTRLLFENLSGLFGQPDVIKRVFSAVPSLGLLLDVGHSNLVVQKNNADELIEASGGRLAHVHFSDNRGGDYDLHLPIGAGRIDWPWIVETLKRAGYDGTITLEVFSSDPEFLAMSARFVRRLWASE